MAAETPTIGDFFRGVGEIIRDFSRSDDEISPTDHNPQAGATSSMIAAQAVNEALNRPGAKITTYPDETEV